MKSLLLLITLAFAGFMFDQGRAVSEQKIEVVTSDHHSCDGTSGIGGTCSATCTDDQGCSCSSGFFTCSCSCDDEAISVELTPGPIENWNTVSDILENSGNSEAIGLAAEMPRVRELAISNKFEEYVKEAKKLDRTFESLPRSIIEEVQAKL